jgi:tRNA dimethylallyltransferase
MSAATEKSPHEPLIIIFGPTAVGKTEISIQLAERLNGEIISADSRLFYRWMDIGTAKPTQAERTRVPHHLIDVCDPDETWSLAVYQKAAYKAIQDIKTRGKLPFLVGGTGQYIKAVKEGWKVPEVKPDPNLRESLNKWAAEIGPQGLYNRLNQIDPQAARRIDPLNVRRTVRALEVILTSGKRFSELRRRGPMPYRTLSIGLSRPRTELYQRIDFRIEKMLDLGLEREVRGLLDKGYRQDLPALSAIGYKQIGEYLQGKISKDEAIRLMKRLTRKFVRRQANWFKLNDPEIHWFTMGVDTVFSIETMIHEFLKSLPD